MKAVLTFVLALLLIVSMASARIINVPDDFETIQAGIDETEDGDTVLVEPGEYGECISFEGKDIKLMGTPEDPSRTVIDGGGNGCVVTFNQGESSDAVLSGFTVTNGSNQDGGGVYCGRSNPTLTNLIITGNTAYRGGGFYSSSSEIVLTNIIITRNTASAWGAAAYIIGGDRVEMSYVLVAQNDAGEGEVGGIVLYNVAQSYLRNVSIVSNTDADGRGLCLVASGYDVTTTMSNCIVWGHTSDQISLEVDFRRGRSITLNISYSDVQWRGVGTSGEICTVNWGDGCVDADPLFADPDNGDYHLTADSPCIDAGDPESPLDPDGTRADMGTFYFHQRDIEVDPLHVDFPPIGWGELDSARVAISNVGGTPLLIEAILASLNPGCIWSEPEGELDPPIEVAPHESFDLWLYFRPDSEAMPNRSFLICSDDPDEDSLVVTALGEFQQVGETQDLTPVDFAITRVYPTPFNSTATVNYSVPAPGDISLRLYDLAGRKVALIYNGSLSAGRYSTNIDGEGLAAGVYLLKLAGNREVSWEKIVMVK